MSTDIYIQIDRVSMCDIPQLSRYNRPKREITAESISELGVFLPKHAERYSASKKISRPLLDLRSTGIYISENP